MSFKNFFELNNSELINKNSREFILEFLKRKNLPINKNDNLNKTYLDWSSLEGFSFNYNFVSAKEIQEALFHIDFFKSKKYYIERWPDGIYKVTGQFIIDNVEDILIDSCMGFFMFSEDEEYFIEFSDDSDYMAYSNFKII